MASGAEQQQPGSERNLINSITNIGDVQTILLSLLQRIEASEYEIGSNASGAEQQLAAIRVDIRGIQNQSGGGGQGGKNFELVDSKSMAPAVFTGAREEDWKGWAKKVKAYTNAKLPGYREALEATEKLGNDNPVDENVMTGWRWEDAVRANSRLHDMLVVITGGEANGIVESVPGKGFEAWRLLNIRFNSVGEMYTFDKMSAIMRQNPVRHISEIPAAIAKFEKDLKVFRERTASEFPEVLKLPLLLQMIPASWKKEFETQFRMPGAHRTYDALANQLLAIGNEERYLSRKRGPNDMDTDALERQRDENHEPITRDMYEGKEARYTEAEWMEWYGQEEEAADYLGAKGKGKSKGGGKSKGKGKGKITAPTGTDGPRDMSTVRCLWCHEYGHFKKDCKKLEQYKKDRDAERARKGDHAPYVYPGKPKGPSRPAGSLDDYYEEVIGLTGDDEPADGIEEFTRQDFEDFMMDDDEYDDVDWEPEMIGIECIVCPKDASKEDECVTPENATTTSPVIDKSTPLSELFKKKDAMAGDPVSKDTREVEMRTQAGKTSTAAPKQGFYQCNWEVLSVGAESESEGEKTADMTNPYDKFGSAVGLALRTDESAKSRSQDQEAQWRGLMTKPVRRHGWPVRRRESKRRDVATQTDITVGSNENAKIINVSENEMLDISNEDEQSIDEDKTMEGQEELTECATDEQFHDPEEIDGEANPDESDGEDVNERATDEQFHEPEEIDGEANPDESDGEDVNVNLTPGERRARLKQKELPDENGYYECNPNDVELCPVEIKERRYKLKRGLTADSGAGDPVIPRRMINSKKIRQSAGSRRGLHYVSATDHRIPNVGEIDLEFQTEEGYDESIIFQVADVNKPLMSISDRVDHRCRVVFDYDEDTGQDISHVYNKQTKKKMRLNRIGKVWVLNCSVTKDFVAENNPVFIGQGK